jgi:hypothetical protein
MVMRSRRTSGRCERVVMESESKDVCDAKLRLKRRQAEPAKWLKGRPKRERFQAMLYPYAWFPFE